MNRTPFSAIALAMALHPGIAHAIDEDPAQEANKADTSFSVGEIVVTARGMARNTDNALTSVDRVDQLLARRRSHLLRLLKQQ